MHEKKISISYQVFAKHNELPPADQALLKAAYDFLPHAYAPYSQFRVAAAVLLENGEIVCGANQENAAYPVSVCAEVTAISASASRYPGVRPVKMAIVASSSAHPTSVPVAPCGQCRQTLLEHENRHGKKLAILLAGSSGQVYELASVKDLLPLHFSANDL